MKVQSLKPLLICNIISFVIVFGGWMCDKWFYEKSSPDSFWILATITVHWVPGAMILSIFYGGWAVIHVDRLINLVPFVSFIFWVIIFLGIRKGFLICKRKFQHKRNSIEEK